MSISEFISTDLIDCTDCGIEASNVVVGLAGFCNVSLFIFITLLQ